MPEGITGSKNIIAHLGGQVFPRIKVGVEKTAEWDLADYVLGHFSKEEQEQMEEGYEHAVCAVKEIVTGNIEAAMNEYNRKRRKINDAGFYRTACGTCRISGDFTEAKERKRGFCKIAGCVNSQKNTFDVMRLAMVFSYKIIVFFQ